MSSKPRSETKGRRAFLTQLAAVGGATATIAVTGRAVAAPDTEEAAPEAKGYRVTPHVSTYYDKARF
jgi:hypothetical protein